MRALEMVLLPRSQNVGRRFMILHGLGGIGKTQLAASFARRQQCDFSSIFWLDVSSAVSLARSLAACISRIRMYSSRSTSPADAADLHDDDMGMFIEWLGRKNNSGWLLILDNVRSEDVIYDYIPDTDHGAVLITTRLSQLFEFGESREMTKADRATSVVMFGVWCSRDLGRLTPRKLVCG
ncbi:hypothetical protein EK21DRAFT_82982 [Setomelanomma holmii]|uniref:NB-ARC domain-containing protein n=1 Tax=Setomelanomma holmii TaxID=210430 RepID=A0A9P4GVK9_9PLEO|nr:hypothetical protein EK21DRAFT_82982 [Setomelanomma holmii]